MTLSTHHSSSQLRLLVLSNGHGEDIIAVRILQELRARENPPEIFVLPIVGEGLAYRRLDFPIIGTVQRMPSGGFIYMDGGKQLMRDVKGGLVQLTWKQIQTTRQWVKNNQAKNQPCAVLAVGDIVPLLFAWLSGGNYGFVGTAKSEYYVRDETKILERKQKGAYWENFSGSIYHPWERWLMTRQRCRAVFPRDSLTTEVLKTMGVPAYDVGNPMMDGLQPSFPTYRTYDPNAEHREIVRPLVVTLLPGSRPPEAYENWQKIMVAVSALIAKMGDDNYAAHTSRNLVFLGAIAPNLDIRELAKAIASQGWRSISKTDTETDQLPVPLAEKEPLLFRFKNHYLILSQNAYNDCLHLADMAIAMAGTATEQFVGLGKPAFIIPGDGPQFNPRFAEAQTRLLGESVILVPQPEEMGQQVYKLLNSPDKLHLISQNGMRRMGKPGAAQRIAECILDTMGNGNC